MEPVDCAGASSIQALRVLWWGVGGVGGGLLQVEPFSLTNLLHRWQTIIPQRARGSWQATSFSEIGVILYYL